MRPAALLILLLAVTGIANAQFRDRESGLVITPPDYLYRQGEDLLAPASLISCWYAPETEEYPWVKMCAERLDRLPPADEKLSFAWGERSVRGSRARIRAGGTDLVQYSALLPLRAGPVRLDVVTPVQGAEDAKAILEETLASVRDEGFASDASEAEHYSARSDVRFARMVGKTGTMMVIVGIGMWIRQRREKKKADREAQGITADRMSRAFTPPSSGR